MPWSTQHSEQHALGFERSHGLPDRTQMLDEDAEDVVLEFEEKIEDVIVSEDE